MAQLGEEPWQENAVRDVNVNPSEVTETHCANSYSGITLRRACSLYVVGVWVTLYSVAQIIGDRALHIPTPGECGANYPIGP